MHDLIERADLVRLHSRAQGLSPADTDTVLSQIDSLDDGPTGWATVWTQQAQVCLDAGRREDAVARFNLARFPFAHTADGHLAHKRCVDLAADVLREAGATRLEVDGTVAWHLSAPDAAADRGDARLLVVCGGIVSIKEQWIALRSLARRLSLAVVFTELPGVGENTARYTPDAPSRLSALLDAAMARQRFSGAFALAMSFGGTVALGALRDDPRIEAVVSVGPPLRHFFDDARWWGRVPQTTKDALTVCTGVAEDVLPQHLSGLGLSVAELETIGVPVTVVASLRDEILPRADFTLARAAIPTAHVVAFDDVHGSPAHLLDTRLLAIAALADFTRPQRPLIRRAAGLALMARRSARELTDIPAHLDPRPPR